MKAWIFSDLHLELSEHRVRPTIPDADICICAGDILDGGLVPTVKWLGVNIAPHLPVVLVPGNHEYYGSYINEGFEAGLDCASYYRNLHLLDGTMVCFNGVRFIGATLWTDFELNGDQRVPMMIAREQLDDYREIKLSKQPTKRFSPRQAKRLHLQARQLIENLLAAPSGFPTVVVTHHAPSQRSVVERFKNDPLAPSFASDLDKCIANHQPDLWVHGHLHTACDYSIGQTRVVCNPGGYPGEAHVSLFDPLLVVDIPQF